MIGTSITNKIKPSTISPIISAYGGDGHKYIRLTQKPKTIFFDVLK